jgi:serine/threonine protein kinase
MDTTASAPGPNPRASLNPLEDPALTSRYELLAEVGRGGMGVVYRARHRSLDRQVAIKVMLSGAASERFLREARLLARIRSPHVVTVHDFELLPSGHPVLVMEWVDGTDLRRLLRSAGGAITEEQALPWMLQACEGMLAAAQQGIIHRDLKPSNLLLDARGRARVADFGLARGPAASADLTLLGGMMGTPYYMAPEQAEDPHGVDTRADIYSFGATFYHALTGRPPFEGETAFSILFKHKTEPLVSPKARKASLSERTSELLERCLAKSPADRFSSFAELLTLLQPSTTVSSPWAASDDAELADYLARYWLLRESYLSRRGAWNADLDVYRFPRGQQLKIVRGDLVAQRVDALVSSDTCHLRMSYGVSEAIRKAAGEAVAAEARTRAPVRPGRAAATSAGNLEARLIFHGVTVGLVGEELVQPSRDLLTEIMGSCF